MSQKTLNLCLERYNFVKFGETTKSSHTVLCINNAYSVNSDKYRLTPAAIASKHGEGYFFTLNYDFDRPLFTIVQKSYALDGTSGNIVFEGIDPISKGGSKYLRKVTVSPVKLSDGSYLLEVTNDEYLRIGTTGAALGDEELESLNEKIVATGGIEKSVETVGGKQVLKLDASGSAGAKEIVYFDVDPSDPPSGIYEAIGEALSNNKLPAIRSEGKLYQYTSTDTDRYDFVGVFEHYDVGYEVLTVWIGDAVNIDKREASLGYTAVPANGTEEHPAWAKVCELEPDGRFGYTTYGLALLLNLDHNNNNDEIITAGMFVLDVGTDQHHNSNGCNASWTVYTPGDDEYSKILGIKLIAKYGVPSNPAYAPYPVHKVEVWVKYYGSNPILVNALQNAIYNSSYSMSQGPYKFPENHKADTQTTEPHYEDTEEYIYREYYYVAKSPSVSYTHVQSLADSEKVLARDNIGAASASDVTALQSQVSSLSDVSAYSVKGEATVAQLNAGPSGIQAGWAYQLTDSGTLTEGSLAVVAGDTVAYDGTKWFPLVKSDYYATKTYAQNVAHSIAPEYNGTTGAEAGRLYMHDGVLYKCKEDTSGDWDSSKFDTASIDELVTYYLLGNVAREYEYKTGVTRNNLEKLGYYDSTYGGKTSGVIPCHAGDKFWIAGAKHASVGLVWATVSDTGTILRRAPSDLNVEFSDNYVITIKEGETGIVFNSALSLLGREKGIRLLNLSKSFGGLYDYMFSLVKSKKFVCNYFGNSGAALTGYYTPETPHLWVMLEKTEGPDSYAIYANDSTGTNNNQILSGVVQFGVPTEVTLPEGYDRLLFYKGGATGVSNDIDLYVCYPNSLESKLDAKLDKSEFNAVMTAETKVYEFRAAANSRLSFYYKPDTSSISFKLVKNAYAQDEYSLYFNDSTATNSNQYYKGHMKFDQVYTVEIPSGYDRLFIFQAGYDENAISVDMFEVFPQSIEFRMDALETAGLPLSGKTILCFGDSITQFTDSDGKHYSDYIAEMSHADVVNVGIGGTQIRLRDTPSATPSTNKQAWAGIDIYNLIHSLCTGDFDTVDGSSQYLYEQEQRDYSAIISRLKDTDLSQVDIVTIFAGTNDFTAQAPLGTDGSEDTSTIIGALTKGIKELLTANPKLRIYVFTPIIRYIGEREPENWSDIYVRNGTTLKAFASGIFDGAKFIHIPVCDMYNTLGWNQWNFSNYFNDNDNTHPYKGFKSLALKMYSFITSNLF